MALEIKVNDSEEFEEMITSKDLRISNALINTILKNINGKKRHYHALSVLVEDDDTIYDITIDREDFMTVLTNHIKIMEYHEEYEICAEILKAIKVLKNSPKKRKRGRPPKKKTVES